MGRCTRIVGESFARARGRRAESVLAVAGALVVAWGSACLRDVFVCGGDEDCAGAGPSPRCEVSGFCSFADPSCDSGRRYAPSGGTWSQTCLGEEDSASTEPVDSDAPNPDGPEPGTSGGGSEPSDGPGETDDTDETDEPASASEGEDATSSGESSDGPAQGETTSDDEEDSSGEGPPPGSILFIGDAVDEADDAPLIARLRARGSEVVVVDQLDVANLDVSSASVVAISSTVEADVLSASLGDVPVPVVVWENNLFGQLGLGSSGGSDNGRTIEIVDPDHPLAAGLEGTVEVFATDQAIRAGDPPSGATVVASQTGFNPEAAIFTVDVSLEDGVAPRIALFLSDGSADDLTPEGWALVDAAFDWALLRSR